MQQVYMHSREWHVYAQAIIVRIMKQRRRLSHEALLLEVSVHLHVCACVCMCACVRVCVCVWGGGGRNPAHLWVTVCVYAGSGEDGDADGIRAHKHRLQKGDNNVFARFCQDSTTISPPCS